MILCNKLINQSVGLVSLLILYSKFNALSCCVCVTVCVANVYPNVIFSVFWRLYAFVRAQIDFCITTFFKWPCCLQIAVPYSTWAHVSTLRSAMIHCLLTVALSPSRFWLLYLLFSHSPSSSFIRQYSPRHCFQSVAARALTMQSIYNNEHIHICFVYYIVPMELEIVRFVGLIWKNKCVHINGHTHRLLRSRCLECKNDGINTLLDNAKLMMQRIFESDNKAQRQNNNNSSSSRSSNKKTNKSNDSIFPSTF